MPISELNKVTYIKKTSAYDRNAVNSMHTHTDVYRVIIVRDLLFSLYGRRDLGWE